MIDIWTNGSERQKQTLLATFQSHFVIFLFASFFLPITAIRSRSIVSIAITYVVVYRPSLGMEKPPYSLNSRMCRWGRGMASVPWTSSKPIYSTNAQVSFYKSCELQCTAMPSICLTKSRIHFQ